MQAGRAESEPTASTGQLWTLDTRLWTQAQRVVVDDGPVAVWLCLQFLSSQHLPAAASFDASTACVTFAS